MLGLSQTEVEASANQNSFMSPDTDALFPLTEKILILKESSNFLIKFYFSNNIIESTVTLFTYAKKKTK